MPRNLKNQFSILSTILQYILYRKIDGALNRFYISLCYDILQHLQKWWTFSHSPCLVLLDAPSLLTWSSISDMKIVKISYSLTFSLSKITPINHCHREYLYFFIFLILCKWCHYFARCKNSHLPYRVQSVSIRADSAFPQWIHDSIFSAYTHIYFFFLVVLCSHVNISNFRIK